VVVAIGGITAQDNLEQDIERMTITQAAEYVIRSFRKLEESQEK